MNVRATFKGELDSRVTDVDGDIAKYEVTGWYWSSFCACLVQERCRRSNEIVLCTIVFLNS